MTGLNLASLLDPLSHVPFSVLLHATLAGFRTDKRGHLPPTENILPPYCKVGIFFIVKFFIVEGNCEPLMLTWYGIVPKKIIQHK